MLRDFEGSSCADEKICMYQDHTCDIININNTLADYNGIMETI